MYILGWYVSPLSLFGDLALALALELVKTRF